MSLKKCLFPRRLTIKYKDGRPARLAVVECGKCYWCRKSHALDWARRICDEAEYWNDGCFLTLTVNEKHMKYRNGLQTLDKTVVQKFLKRLRKSLDGKELAYFAVGEYGGKRGRPHYHMILFGFSPPDAEYIKRSYSGFPLYKSAMLEKIWQQGFVFLGKDLQRDCYAYCAKYCHKKRFRPDEFFFGRQAEFQLSSRNILGFGAIGARWMKNNLKTIERGYLNDKSTPRVIVRLPKYYYDYAVSQGVEFDFRVGDIPGIVSPTGTTRVYWDNAIEHMISADAGRSARSFEDEQ